MAPIGISPDAVVLVTLTLEDQLETKGLGLSTNQLAVTDNSHHTERLHAVLLWVKFRISVLISKDHVGVNIRVQVRNAKLLDIVLERCLSLSAGIVGACASAIVRSITVDVHISVCATVRAGVQEDCARNISTVGHIAFTRGTITEFSLENFVALRALQAVRNRSAG